MKIFITGASGFVGGATASHFIQEGHQVYGMARSQASANKLKSLGVKPIHCDLTSVSGQQLAGIEVVVHAAAYVEAWGKYNDYFDANVTGTKNMLLAASQAKSVEKFIHISTEACLFDGSPLKQINEDSPYPETSPYHYSVTKKLAELAVIEQGKSGDMQTMIIRPRLIWGPGDQTILPEIKKMVAAGQFMWIDRGVHLTDSTHIYNLVHAIDLAVQKGKNGGLWFVTDNEQLTMKEFLSKLLATAKIKVSDKSMPHWFLRPLAALVERTYRLVGSRKQPPLTRFAIDMMSVECTINIDRIKNDLGYSPVVSISEGMKQITV